MGSPIIIGLRADSKSRGFFGERMRTDVSRETSRLTGMRTAPTSRAGTLRRPRIRIGNPRASPGGGRRGRASRGAPVGEGASRGGGPAAAFGPNGLAPASPAEGREAGRQRMRAMHDYRGLPTEARRETPGRKKWRGRRIVHRGGILFHVQGNDPSQGARRHGFHPAPPLQRVRMFHVKHPG